ncbi:MAG: tRNA (N6-isopentenyl adenosine(37)-C2)-methylthiotransferase MiaB [Clostridiales bacterium]|jgi:tRNA-2-methylthio-N6-dimethylallyladenosine synthase|nr:tRNA (N6-isopentenyl adenosine(37)-C2)-methylthiotransferase MiaB [Clostridiales bacterium]
MTYHMITYGCQMNVHDSEKIAGVLARKGYVPTENALADVVVFNTCCVRETAENRALGALSAYKGKKQEHPGMVLCVVGCVPQKGDALERLKKDYPYVDVVLGTHNQDAFERALDEVLLDRRKRFVEVVPEASGMSGGAAAARGDTCNAWVNIMYGCNNFCSYCIVPYVRGRERSRPPAEILDEVRSCLDAGYKEITLLGQNVNSYAPDFAALLRAIAALPGAFRLKFMTSHPKDLSDGVIAAIRDCDKISRFIHLPAQSGSTRILHAMNRRYTRGDYLRLVEKIRAALPDAGLSSDFIVGFPGETDADFEDTLSLVDAVRFNNAFSFMYSRRSGTVAAGLPEQVPYALKKERVQRLIAKVRQTSAALAAECTGKTYRALIERDHNDFKGGKPIATTDCGKTVFLETDAPPPFGDFVRIRVTRNRGGRLFGELV